MCILAAEALHLKPEDIIVASTGVIGQVLPIEPIEKGIAALAPIMSREGNLDAVLSLLLTTKALPLMRAIGFRPTRAV